MVIEDDGWTAVTKDGSLSAHFEHSVAITENGPFVLSARTVLERQVSLSRGKRTAMKVRASVKKVCEKCKVIRRRGVVRVICENARHKQRQG